MWMLQSFPSLLPCWCKNCVLFPPPSPSPPPHAWCSKSWRPAHGEWLVAALSSAKQYCANAIPHNQKINTRFSSPTLSPSSASWKPPSHKDARWNILWAWFIQATMTPTQRLTIHWQKHKTESTGNNTKLNPLATTENWPTKERTYGTLTTCKLPKQRRAKN